MVCTAYMQHGVVSVRCIAVFQEIFMSMNCCDNQHLKLFAFFYFWPQKIIVIVDARELYKNKFTEVLFLCLCESKATAKISRFTVYTLYMQTKCVKADFFVKDLIYIAIHK